MHVSCIFFRLFNLDFFVLGVFESCLLKLNFIIGCFRQSTFQICMHLSIWLLMWKTLKFGSASLRMLVWFWNAAFLFLSNILPWKFFLYIYILKLLRYHLLLAYKCQSYRDLKVLVVGCWYIVLLVFAGGFYFNYWEWPWTTCIRCE